MIISETCSTNLFYIWLQYSVQSSSLFNTDLSYCFITSSYFSLFLLKSFSLFLKFGNLFLVNYPVLSPFHCLLSIIVGLIVKRNLHPSIFPPLLQALKFPFLLFILIILFVILPLLILVFSVLLQKVYSISWILDIVNLNLSSESP